MTFEEKQQQKQTAFHMSINSKASTYILNDNEREKNIYKWQDKESLQQVKNYFSDHNIKWWNGPFDAPERKKPDGKI